jgi:hypothetical protein
VRSYGLRPNRRRKTRAPVPRAFFPFSAGCQYDSYKIKKLILREQKRVAAGLQLRRAWLASACRCLHREGPPSSDFVQHRAYYGRHGPSPPGSGPRNHRHPNHFAMIGGQSSHAIAIGKCHDKHMATSSIGNTRTGWMRGSCLGRHPAIAVVSPAPAHAQAYTETVLYTFTGGTDGQERREVPPSRKARDYGMTSRCGIHGR